MAFEFHLPDIGEGLTEATVVRWLVDVGDEVALDATVVELETDKAVVEMPAPRAGVVLHHGAAVGEVLEVGELLVVIGEAGETWNERPSSDREPPRRATEAAPIVGSLEESPQEGPQALPMVRRLAAELGVDLASVQGTGRDGRITREDVEAAGSAGADVERVPLSPTRLAIARNMTRAWREIPHVTTYGRAAAEPLLAARHRLADETGRPVPVEALLIHSVVPLLEAFPEFNATLAGDHLLLRHRYDVGFAVAGPEGLLVAVVRGADGRGPADLAAEIVRLADAARDRTLHPDELRGATFTVSNVGAVGGGYGTPIIPFGTTAILSVGRADERPVVRDGALAVGREFPLSLSYDHRVVDGARGRQFMGSLVDAIESH